MEEKVLCREDRYYDTAACCLNCNNRYLNHLEDPCCDLDDLIVEDHYWCNMHE